jgi:hypothetical protein
MSRDSPVTIFHLNELKRKKHIFGFYYTEKIAENPQQQMTAKPPLIVSFFG